MNRFTYGGHNLTLPSESLHLEAEGIRIYEEHNRTAFDNGILRLTTHRLIWFESLNSPSLLLDLALIESVSEEVGSLFHRSDKLVVLLREPPVDKFEGPKSNGEGRKKNGKEAVIRFSFRRGGCKIFKEKLLFSLNQKNWSLPSVKNVHKIRSGIGGIEKSRNLKAIDTEFKISKAFNDIDQLMNMAKPMVELSKSISSKLKEVSEDETRQFKSYLLSLGINDPVTREAHNTDSAYYRQLAQEMYNILEGPISENGGMMTLTNAFCRINRARGLELLSPEDLMSAVLFLPQLNVPLHLHTFESNVMVLVTTQNKFAIQKELIDFIVENEFCSPEDYSAKIGLSLTLAKERLLEAERAGIVCRDDSLSGLSFYPNKFNEETNDEE